MIVETDNNIKPISLKNSIILFSIPGIILFIGFYYIIPILNKIDVPLLLSFPFFLWIGIIPLLPVSIFLYKKEKREHSTLDFKKRFRLEKIKRRDWLWVVGGISFVIVSDFVIGEPISKWMAGINFFEPPGYFPAIFNPLKDISLPLESILGVSLKGNWWVLVVTIPIHIVAMISEEFIWRGYILPRQEIKYGKYAWIVNGLLWAYIVHGFMKWNYISFLPSMLVTPWIAQKTKNTWVSFLVHAIPNTLLWVLLLFSILGIG